jgi:aspartyl-tRNA(Asn)/glutamyl-tRNA(Gln) amidotransferase subunit B
MTTPAVKIGLEIHGYLDVPSRVKLFCSCSLEPAEPNSNICPVCTGQPGSKPMLPNREAIDAILRIALFLECSINPELLFQRKHYSWPDLPNGYQKTMSGAYSQPVGLNGKFLDVGIEEIHLEEDPARWDPVSGGVDYNRSGFPLVEIVTKPEFTSAQHAREWLESLMVALGYIKAVRRDLGVKCDVNVSVAPDFIRTEVKNVNSFSAIHASILHEVTRQSTEPREERKQQTRAWDDASGTTKFMRSKETALDYLFIPDPDLPVIVVTDELLAPIKASLPERPDQKEAKYVMAGVKAELAKKLASNLYFANYAEEMQERNSNIPMTFFADRFVNEVAASVTYGENLISIQHIEKILVAFHQRDIDNLTMKVLLEKVGEGNAESIAHIDTTLHHSKDNKQSDDALTPLVADAIAANPVAVADIKKGNDKAINAVVGHVIKALKANGKSADPAVIQKLVREALDESGGNA